MPRGRIGVPRAYSSRACATHPAVRAMANTASPAPATMPATDASAASAKSMFGSGRARLRASVITASATASRSDPGRRLPEQIHKQHGTRIAPPVDEVTEARDPLPAPEPVAYDSRSFVRMGRGPQHDLGAERGAAVQRAAHGAEPGRHHGVRVGPHRGSYPGRQRGRGELMIGQQDHGCAQRLDERSTWLSRAQPDDQPLERSTRLVRLRRLAVSSAGYPSFRRSARVPRR